MSTVDQRAWQYDYDTSKMEILWGKIWFNQLGLFPAQRYRKWFGIPDLVIWCSNLTLRVAYCREWVYVQKSLLKEITWNRPKIWKRMVILEAKKKHTHTHTQTHTHTKIHKMSKKFFLFGWVQIMAWLYHLWTIKSASWFLGSLAAESRVSSYPATLDLTKSFGEKPSVFIPRISRSLPGTPRPTIYKLLFQLDDLKSLHAKWLEITKHPFLTGCLGFQVDFRYLNMTRAKLANKFKKQNNKSCSYISKVYSHRFVSSKTENRGSSQRKSVNVFYAQS